MWFHLPLISALLLMCSLGAVFLSRRAKKMKRQQIQKKSEQVESLLAEMEEELWKEENETKLQRFYLQFSSLGWTSSKVDLKIQEIRALQSLQAGVSMAYLLQDFKDLAQQRSKEVDPTFLHLKDVFWGCEDKIGQDVLCPRDGQLGCALVDWLPRHHRRQQTHFLSWSWRYSLGQLRSALEMWNVQTHRDVFFYICFFVNNQFRIIVDQRAAGSDNLEHIFQENLRRIGQVVAVLDTWQEPIYLQRVWTIYEQFVACSMNIPVVFVMPQEATSSLSQRLSLGDDGISEVTRSLCNVNVSQAEAFDPRDEKKVKDTIQNTVGFERVNQHVKSAMVQWIGAVVREKFQRLVNEAEEDTFHV